MFSVPFAALIESDSTALCEKLTERRMNLTYLNANRTGDHIRYLNSARKFQSHDLSWHNTRLSRPLGWHGLRKHTVPTYP
jgi:hypothetical protein